MKGKLRLALCGFVITALLLGASPALAAGPILPHAFYGTVAIGDHDAPVGSVVSAEVGGVDCGSYSIGVAGRYGNLDERDYLTVQGDIANGDTITFYVNGVSTSQTATFEAGGGPTRLDLTVPETVPSVATSAATSVTTSSATLNGNLGSLGTTLSVEVSFEWGTTTAYGNTATVTASPLSVPGVFSASVSGLSSGTTYHFRAKAMGDGTTYGIDSTFTTGTVPTAPPAVTTDPATGVTTTLATLNGSLTDLGTATAVGVSFEWGETSAYGNETTPRTMTSTGAFSSSLSGLSPDITYHFRAKAVGDSTSYGIDRAFTTRARAGGIAPSPPAPPPGTTDVRGEVSAAGVFLTSVVATSDDELCTLTIPEDTVGLTEELEPLVEITMVIMDEPPRPPKKAEIVGLAYDFGPDGATFEPAITLTWSYAPADIPEGVPEEDLVIAYYDEAAAEWIELDCVVDTENDTITASVEHFTTFAILGAVPPEVEVEEIAELEKTIRELETQVASLRGDYDTAKSDLAAAQAKVASAQGDYDTAKSNLAAAQAKVASVQGDYDTAKSNLAAAQARVASLQSDLAEAQERLAEAQERIAELEAAPPNWALIGGIIAAVLIVVAWLVLFLVVRRRAELTKR